MPLIGLGAGLFSIGLGLGWLIGIGTSTPDEADQPLKAPTAALEQTTPAPQASKADESRSLRTADVETSAPRRAAKVEGANASPPQPVAKPAHIASLPPFERFAAPRRDVPAEMPKLAIVLDDLGLSRTRVERALTLPSAVTLAFLSYAPNLPALTAKAREAGHELLVHVPMQPHDETWDTGKNSLKAELPASELARRLSWALSRFEGFIGINNHMGSAFTENRQAMDEVFATLGERGLMFLDSRTTPKSVAGPLAKAHRVPFVSRDVFLDNKKDAAAIRSNLEEAARIAREAGQAVAIGHPYPVTLEVLQAWLPKAYEKGVAVVPLSMVTRRPDSTISVTSSAVPEQKSEQTASRQIVE